MLVACEIFEADWCTAYPSALIDFDEPGACKIGWMTYIGPEPAPLITPPPNVIVEHRPDGGLFMAATQDSFNVDDPGHLAAARAIVAVPQAAAEQEFGWHAAVGTADDDTWGRAAGRKSGRGAARRCRRIRRKRP